MRLIRLIAGLALAGLASTAPAQVAVMPPGWAVGAAFPAQPERDEFRRATDRGDQVSDRRYLQAAGCHYLLVRVAYPVVPPQRGQDELYARSVAELLKSRPGELRDSGPFRLGDYPGLRLVIDHRRERTVREVRLVQAGGCLYVASAEWPAAESVPAEPARFLQSLVIRPGFEDPRSAAERERWRELRSGNFSLRYDATRWYRDPTDREAGVFNLLRVDRRAEAQMIAEAEPLLSPSMEETVLATARENSESVALRRHGHKVRGDATVEELEFTARAEGATYVNHGYFYTGPAGALQLRSWSAESTYALVADDITELLDGLRIDVPAAAPAGR